MGFTLPKQNDEELPIGEDGHTRAPDHTRDRMGDFASVPFWNWTQPSTDWFNLETGKALAEYNPSPAMRELVAGVESQRADPRLSESAEKSVISLSSTQSKHARRPSFERIGGSVHENFTRPPRTFTRPTTNFTRPPRISSASTHQSTHADTSPDRADTNDEIGAAIRFGISAQQFVLEFGAAIALQSVTQSGDRNFVAKMRAPPVRGARTPCSLDIGGCGGKREAPAMPATFRR